jgi:2',3'-cyclic-nucleotide 2'-phosphodiesterase (5'-nucleotidase family)
MRALIRRALRARLAVLLAIALPSLASGEILTIVHVNDTHSYLDAVGPKDANLDGTLGGLTKAATVIEGLEASEPNVVLLHAGDFSHGDLFWNRYAFGAAELQILSALGFDAIAIGNHEFDATPAGLAAAIRCAFATNCGFGGPMPAVPMLSANVMAAGTVLDGLVEARTIVAAGGLKVGIFALTNPDLPTMLNEPVPVVGEYPHTDVLLGIAGQQAAMLRSEGADVVVFLSHLGIAYDRAVAAYVPGIDVIVGAHDHYVFLEPIWVGAVPIVQAGEHYGLVGKLSLDVDPITKKVEVLDAALLPVDAAVPRDPAIAAWVDQLKAGIVQKYGDVYHTVVATASADVPKWGDLSGQTRDAPMGNVITDAYRWNTGTEVGITANGFIEVGLWAGPIVGADLFRPVSYYYDPPTGLGLRIATFEIEGAELVEALEASLAYLGVNDDFLLQISGMRFDYDSSKPVGQRVVGSVHVGGRPLDPAATYTATANTALLKFLPDFGIAFSNPQVLGTEYEALVAYVAHREILEMGSQNRIRDVSAR